MVFPKHLEEGSARLAMSQRQELLEFEVGIDYIWSGSVVFHPPQLGEKIRQMDRCLWNCLGGTHQLISRVEDLSPKHLGKQSHRSCLEVSRVWL